MTSTTGFLKLIFFLQKRHLPRRNTNDKTGTKSIIPSVLLQLSQRDLPRIERFLGTRSIITLRKLPAAKPKRRTITVRTNNMWRRLRGHRLRRLGFD